MTFLILAVIIILYGYAVQNWTAVLVGLAVALIGFLKCPKRVSGGGLFDGIFGESDKDKIERLGIETADIDGRLAEMHEGPDKQALRVQQAKIETELAALARKA